MDAKTAARETVGTNAQTLVGLSHRVHAHPELKFEEVRSSAWTAGVLADAGLSVDAGICDLPTAFSCSFGSGSLHLAICAEYDALPGIGHACGHNIIAATAVGAALALAPLVDDLDLKISVIGTPAEEGGGGKVFLLERGAFAGVDAAMMVHPAPFEDLTPRVSAVAHFDVTYDGHPSHAAAAPHLGVNAADAMTVAQVAIGLLRQHLNPGDQVHGFVTARRRRGEHRARAHRRTVDGARADDRRPRRDATARRALLRSRRDRDRRDPRDRGRVARCTPTSSTGRTSSTSTAPMRSRSAGNPTTSTR